MGNSEQKSLPFAKIAEYSHLHGDLISIIESALLPVSAVIVNHNAGDLLVKSVTEALSQAQQVIVVDNASTDDSMANLSLHFKDEKRLKLIYSDVNLGFAAGCNLGYQACENEYILFLNPDCILRPGTLFRLLDSLHTSPEAGIVGGMLSNPDGTEQAGGRRAIPTPWRSFVRAFGLAKLGKRWPRLFNDFNLHQEPLPDESVEVEAISGALMLVRQDAFEQIGCWDEDYFLHCEDLDLCMRFRQAGWKVLFVPDAGAIHYQGTCGKTRQAFVEWHKHKSMLRFYRKFFRYQYPGALMWLVVLGVLLRFTALMIKYGLQDIFSSSRFRRVKKTTGYFGGDKFSG